MSITLNTEKVAGGSVSHLVIPDSHAYPGDNFRRYEWLGKLIMDKRPDVIINIGDHWDMSSLCSYDEGKKDFVTRSITEDIESGHKAEELIFGPMLKHNKGKWRKSKYTPTIIKCIGNHEVRLKRLLDYQPQLEGAFSMDDFKTRLDIDEVVVDFLDFAVVDGIAYSHYFVTGVSGRPCSSARALVTKKNISCTMGHSHNLENHSVVKLTGEKLRGLICGSFHDKEHKGFAGPQTDEIWWNGLIHKHNVSGGDYDMEEISVTRLEAMYG